jgi:hypothetical protein
MTVRWRHDLVLHHLEVLLTGTLARLSQLCSLPLAELIDLQWLFDLQLNCQRRGTGCLQEGSRRSGELRC